MSCLRVRAASRHNYLSVLRRPGSIRLHVTGMMCHSATHQSTVQNINMAQPDHGSQSPAPPPPPSKSLTTWQDIVSGAFMSGAVGAWFLPSAASADTGFKVGVTAVCFLLAIGVRLTKGPGGGG